MIAATETSVAILRLSVMGSTMLGATPTGRSFDDDVAAATSSPVTPCSARSAESITIVRIPICEDVVSVLSPATRDWPMALFIVSSASSTMLAVVVKRRRRRCLSECRRRAVFGALVGSGVGPIVGAGVGTSNGIDVGGGEGGRDGGWLGVDDGETVGRDDGAKVGSDEGW